MGDVKRVAVLGSTGSIGRSTLDVIARHPGRLRLTGLAARTSIEALAAQAAAHPSARVAVWDTERAAAFGRLTGRTDTLPGTEGLIALATAPETDIVVVATSGRDALIPLVRAIQAGKQIALASKELLVMAGSLIMRLVEEHGTTLVPIDSEHAALFQCLQGVKKDDVRRLTITASGGPLWGLTSQARQAATREQVLAHPKWRMGPKITVDSATLMNKGLEVIEAQRLFGFPLDRFRVLVHPEAAVHAIIELRDGTSLAQVSPCDMRLPIQYALSFPERWDGVEAGLPLSQAGPLRFFEPDLNEFPCLRLALEAAAAGGSMCVALNGANETAVAAYLAGQVAFGDIPRAIADTLAQHDALPHPTLDEILAVDAWARQATQESIVSWSAR